MISPSKRRRPEQQADATFRLHEVTARQLAGSLRVRRAALGALVAALLLALVKLMWPVGLAVHLGAALLGALVGALMPVAPQMRRALDQIGRATGLAYESALGVITKRAVPPTGEASPPAEDTFGLEAKLLDRARRAVADFRLEPPPQWWLPITVLALAVVGLSQLLPSVLAPGRVTTAETERSATAEEVLPQQPLEELLPAPLASSRADAPGVPNAPGGGADSRDALPPGGSDAGNDALSRFLEALRQGQAGGEPGERQGGGAEPAGANPQQATDGRTPQPYDPRSPSEAAEAGAASEAAQAGGGTAQPQEQASQPDPGSPPQAGAQPSEGSEDGGANGQQSSASRAQGQQGQENHGLDAGDEVAPGPGAGEQQRAGAGDDGSAGAGGAKDGTEGLVGAGGAELADDGSQPDGLFSAGGAQLLPGVLLDGPTTAAGNVRLPGDDQVELPPGTALAPYGAAVEEALGEGDLPAGYQEIIRRYFQ